MWLRRLLGGTVRLQCRVRRGDALDRLRNLGAVVLLTERYRGTGRVIGHAAVLTPLGIIVAGSLR